MEPRRPTPDTKTFQDYHLFIGNWGPCSWSPRAPHGSIGRAACPGNSGSAFPAQLKITLVQSRSRTPWRNVGMWASQNNSTLAIEIYTTRRTSSVKRYLPPATLSRTETCQPQPSNSKRVNFGSSWAPGNTPSPSPRRRSRTRRPRAPSASSVGSLISTPFSLPSARS